MRRKPRTSYTRRHDTEFGARLRRLRTRLGLTQVEFANRYCISFQALQKWEQGVRTPCGMARTYISVIERMPDQVAEALRQAILEEAEEIPYNPSRE